MFLDWTDPTTGTSSVRLCLMVKIKGFKGPHEHLSHRIPVGLNLRIGILGASSKRFAFSVMADDQKKKKKKMKNTWSGVQLSKD